LKALRVVVNRVENLLKTLRSAIQSDRSKIIDLPAVPLRRISIELTVDPGKYLASKSFPRTLAARLEPEVSGYA
jgi:hypothetical protein